MNHEKISTRGARQLDSIREEYAGIARVYDSRWSFYIAASTRETIARLNIRPYERVLDVGCGTGIMLAQIGRRFPTVDLVGVDPVTEMLAIARQRLGASARVVQGVAESLPLPDRCVDVVVSCSALHYFDDPTKSFREMKRVLRPGGQLVVTDWRLDYWTLPFIRIYLRATGRVLGRIFRSDELVALFAETGFSQPKVARYRLNWMWGLMTGNARKRGTQSGWSE
ncbi:MAG: methyltransferase domain-containing protein [Opitutaceae bacterium]